MQSFLCGIAKYIVMIVLKILFFTPINLYYKINTRVLLISIMSGTKPQCNKFQNIQSANSDLITSQSRIVRKSYPTEDRMYWAARYSYQTTDREGLGRRSLPQQIEQRELLYHGGWETFLGDHCHSTMMPLTWLRPPLLQIFGSLGRYLQ